MKAPQTYKEWCDCLALFEAGGHDDTMPDLLAQGSLVWQGEVAIRIGQRFHEAFIRRLKLCDEHFKTHLRALDMKHPEKVEKAMLETRRILSLLFRLARTEALAASLRDLLVDLLDQNAANWQKNLEENAERLERSGALLLAVRRSSLLTYRNASGAPGDDGRPPVSIGGPRPPIKFR